MSKKNIIDCVMVSNYHKDSGYVNKEYYEYECISHNMKYYAPRFDEIDNYTKHVVRIPINKPFGVDVETLEHRTRVDDVVITWYWDKKIPFNFKHFDKDMLKLDEFCDYNLGLIYNHIDLKWLHHLEKEKYNEVDFC